MLSEDIFDIMLKNGQYEYDLSLKEILKILYYKLKGNIVNIAVFDMDDKREHHLYFTYKNKN